LVLVAIVAEQLVLCLIVWGVLSNDFIWTYSTAGIYSNFYLTQFLFAGCFGLFYLSHVGLAKSVRDLKDRRINVDLRLLNIGTGIATAVCLLVFAVTLNWSIVWHNNQYLAMADPDVALRNHRLGILFGLVRTVGLLSTVACALNLARGNKREAWIFAALLSFPLLYELGAHSRVAAAFPLIFVLTLHATDRKNFFAVKIAGVVGCLVFVALGLFGRGLFDHGLITIPRTVEVTFADMPTASEEVITNIFEGSTTVAESLNLSADFGEPYKVLSFMPTPSFVDGFSDIQESYVHRLSYYAPMSGLVEIFDFGTPFILLFCAIVFVSARAAFSLANSNYTAFLIANLFQFIGFFTLTAYSTRTGLKWFWVADGLVLAVYTARQLSVLGWTPNRMGHPQTTEFGPTISQKVVGVESPNGSSSR
jgi:hypothetical protein